MEECSLGVLYPIIQEDLSFLGGLESRLPFVLLLLFWSAVRKLRQLGDSAS